MTQTLVSPQKSTIVRLFRAPWPLRAAFATLDRVAPGIGARWAERIWMTLPPSRPRRDSHPGGARFTVSVDGRPVAGEVWGDGPPVYLVHGWAGHRGQFTGFVGPLVALPMHRHHSAAKAQTVSMQQTEQEATVAVAYDIAD